jgi:excinuclease ABC subunit C
MEKTIDLKTEALSAPEAPGCYIMRGADGRVIYVGKAKVLRKRLVSYFRGDKDIKTATLVQHARSIETIIVANEYEALLLENTLIKQHSPKYNIDLKDGKSYPVVRVTNDPFPRIFKTRYIVEDGSRYFGPYAHVQSIETLLSLIEKLFPLRKCKRLRARKAPCMYYHIKRCAAPCCGKISARRYGSLVRKACALLSGETEGLVLDLTEQMHKQARRQRFEQAALLRDVIHSIENIPAANAVVDFDNESRDYIACAEDGVLTTFSVFSFRGGSLTGREIFPTYSAAEQSESMVTFIMNYYTPERRPPAKLYVDFGTIGSQQTETGNDEMLPPALSTYFESVFSFVPAIEAADNTRDRPVINMARLNAMEDVRKRVKERGNMPALAELKKVLNLKSKPVRIEGFDIAQLDGKHPVASLVSFKNGVPDKKNYRFFKLKTVVGIVDDYAAITEAVRRRYTRLLRDDLPLPDLILIDGGLGQVNAAKSVLDELGMETALAGLAKRNEEIWLPSGTDGSANAPDGANTPLILSRRSDALKVLQAVRDETHRFATGLNQRLRSKDLNFGVLESVEGISATRAAALMREFGSLAAIAEAKPQDIAALCSINEKLAKTVKAAVKLALLDAETNKVVPR